MEFLGRIASRLEARGAWSVPEEEAGEAGEPIDPPRVVRFMGCMFRRLSMAEWEADGTSPGPSKRGRKRGRHEEGKKKEREDSRPLLNVSDAFRSVRHAVEHDEEALPVAETLEQAVDDGFAEAMLEFVGRCMDRNALLHPHSRKMRTPEEGQSMVFALVDVVLQRYDGSKWEIIHKVIAPMLEAVLARRMKEAAYEWCHAANKFAAVVDLGLVRL